MEILACPHCHRLFRATPAVLGKKIRCRGCRQIFYVPKDTSAVPLGPEMGAAVKPITDPPVAIACVKDGLDARRCPECRREFLLKLKFIDKVIRCRGCKSLFRVKATPTKQQEQVIGTEAPQLQPRPPALPPAVMPCSTVFEDIGDVLDELQPGENFVTAERPRHAATRANYWYEPLASCVAILFGGACALPVAQLILWWGFGKDPLGIGPLLPLFLRPLAPEPFWN